MIVYTKYNLGTHVLFLQNRVRWPFTTCLYLELVRETVYLVRASYNPYNHNSLNEVYMWHSLHVESVPVAVILAPLMHDVSVTVSAQVLTHKLNLVIVSDVYALDVSRSWRDWAMDVKLSVCGSLQYLKAVCAAYLLRLLSIPRGCCARTDCTTRVLDIHCFPNQLQI